MKEYKEYKVHKHKWIKYGTGIYYCKVCGRVRFTGWRAL